jgi:thioester reductase-like protein
VLTGNLTEERIGVTADTWQMMCETIDCVIHNASDVNFAKSYAQIRKVNVTPVKTLLNFCGSARLKAFNYISTAGVFSGAPFNKDSRISESHRLGNVSDLVSGYLKSKWVAEQVIALAKEKDYPVFIYRPGNISGDHQLGRTNVDNFFLKFTQAIVQDGTIPASVHSINVIPVNFVSDCIVRLSLKKDLTCRDYNLVNPRPLNLSRFTGMMKLSGYPLEVVDTGLWIRNIVEKAAAGEYHPLQVFLPLLQMPEGERNILDAVFSIPRLPMVSVHEELGNEQLLCPPVGMELMQTYFDYFDKHALLESAERTQERSFISFKENMYGFGSGIDSDHQKGYTDGMLRGLRIEMYTDCRIKSLTHLLRDKKIMVSGKVICDYLSDDPLTILDGYWEIRPLKGVNVEDPDKQIIIEHNYTIRSQKGDTYHFYGKKTTAAGFDLLKETTTLYVTIRKDSAHGPKVVKGIMEVDMVEFVRDQVFNIEIDQRVNANDQLIVKGVWLSILFGNIATQNIENNFRWLAGTFFNDPKLMNSISQLISTFRTT